MTFGQTVSNIPWRIPVAQLLSTYNQAQSLRAKALPFLDRLSSKPEVIGLGVLGGLAESGIRHFADKYSDIDITVLLDCEIPAELLRLPPSDAIAAAQDLLPRWLPNFKFRDPDSDVEFNVHQHILKYESQPGIVWDNDKCSAYADTLEIVYDPSGSLASLIRNKTAGREERAFDATLRLLSRGLVMATDGVRTCLGRARIDVARDIITRVSYEALDVLLFLSGIWPPGPKWRLVAVEALLDGDEWLQGWTYQRFLALLHASAIDEDGCLVSRGELIALLEAIEAVAKRTFHNWPTDVYAYAMTRVFPDKQLLALTAADTAVGASFDYSVKLIDSEWNRVNHALEEPLN